MAQINESGGWLLRILGIQRRYVLDTS